MTTLERLKMELSNQQYLTDVQYIQLLTENNLTSTIAYDKATMQKSLLMTVLDVLDAVANDIDLMTSISTEFSNIGQAYQFIDARIGQVKDKISSIPEVGDDYNCFSLMYTRNDVRNYTPATYGSRAITNSEIDSMIK